MRADLYGLPTRGRGPVGTGVHLLRVSEVSSVVTKGEAWLTLAFLPLFPLGTWVMERPNDGRRGFRIASVSSPGLSSLWWVVGGLACLSASIVPAYCAISFLIGSQKTALAGLFSSAGAIIGMLGWLDQTRDRIPLGVALQAIRGMTRSGAHEPGAGSAR